MVHPSVIEARLNELHFRFSQWFRPEIHELQHVLLDNEKIIALACGRYFGSFALLVATDQRLLLIDKRLFFMNFEDTRYDMISEIDFNSQAYIATVSIHTLNKMHKFTSIKHRQQLRDLTHYVQRRVMEFRNQQSALMSGEAVPISGETPIPQPQAASPAPAVPAAAPPLGTSYNYSPATSDDSKQTVPSDGVVQMVGSTVMQAAHHWPNRPINPYLQGSLMTRHPFGSETLQG
ncbi:MAG: PH domain-containing protein [Candidatus Saccharimonadales bacterium]